MFRCFMGHWDGMVVFCFHCKIIYLIAFFLFFLSFFLSNTPDRVSLWNKALFLLITLNKCFFLWTVVRFG